jgi:hypothetical protein
MAVCSQHDWGRLATVLSFLSLEDRFNFDGSFPRVDSDAHGNAGIYRALDRALNLNLLESRGSSGHHTFTINLRI